MVDLVSIYLIAWSVLFPTLVKEPIAFFWFLWFGLVQHFIQIQISCYCLTYEFPPGGWGTFPHGINLGFWETVLLPPGGLRGGVGGQLSRNLNWSHKQMPFQPPPPPPGGRRTVSQKPKLIRRICNTVFRVLTVESQGVQFHYSASSKRCLFGSEASQRGWRLAIKGRHCVLPICFYSEKKI